MRESTPGLFAAIHIIALSLACGQTPPPDVADADKLDREAHELADHGKFSEAAPIAAKALNLREQIFGPQHPEVAKSLNNLGDLYRLSGDFAKARPLLERAMAMFEKEPGIDERGLANCLNNLAVLYRESGEYTKAESLFQRAVAIREKVLGPESAELADTLSNFGDVYRYTGDAAKAEPLYQRAIKIFEKTSGPNDPNTAGALNALGDLYRDMGDYSKAELLLQRAIAICEKAVGPEHVYTATGVNDLAHVYLAMGAYDKAAPLFERTVKIYEKVLGPEHPYTATSLNNLATAYQDMGEYSKAESLLKRAIAICTKSLGPEHPDTGRSINNLGVLYHKMGKYDEAEALFARALKIAKKRLGSDHPHTAISLERLALVKIALGKPAEAVALMKQARAAEESHLSNILSFTSEQQRLEFQKTLSPYDVAGTLGEAPELTQAVLRVKGIVLDSLLEDRLIAEASGDANERQVIGKIRNLKDDLTKLELGRPKDLSEEALNKRNAQRNEVSRKIDELEAELARHIAGLGKARRALTVTAAQVQAAMRPGESLIELLRYGQYLGSDKFEPRYGAIVLGSRGDPRWVPLGSADKIDQSMQLYQKSARGSTDSQTLTKVLQDLYGEIWAPIERMLPSGTSRVIISPDGNLNFLSFATLVDPRDRFLSETYSVRYVASGRDLLRQDKATVSRTTVVYANPDFKLQKSERTRMEGYNVAFRAAEITDLKDISLTALPGTAVEAAALKKKFGNSAEVFVGADANKAQLQRVDSPRILHLATHGFFLSGNSSNTGSSGSLEQGRGARLVNPMHRSGLALAGAQKTLEAWSRGEVPPIENDGIVTAEEVGGLKLNGTWLVVLSACDTGLGEARAGEGVMGLRRGFIQAGAQNLLMTLWPISDQTTVQIMLDFYDAADKTKNAPQALAEVQRDWLVKLRKERGLLDAVRLAGAFIMSSQGK